MFIFSFSFRVINNRSKFSVFKIIDYVSIGISNLSLCCIYYIRVCLIVRYYALCLWLLLSRLYLITMCSMVCIIRNIMSVEFILNEKFY